MEYKVSNAVDAFASNMVLSENGYFNRKYDRMKQKPERNSGKQNVELKGFITNEQRIQNIINAGNRLMAARSQQYDFLPGQKVDENAVDKTRNPGYDMADMSQDSMALAEKLQASKAAAEKAAAGIPENEKKEKSEEEKDDKRSSDGNG